MPRALTPHDPLDFIEDELTFTISALRSDPHGAAFLGLTTTWMERLEEVRKLDRITRRKVVTTDARRVVANENLDDTCEAFAEALLEAVEGDQRSERWRRFFTVPVHRFVRQALRTQVTMVEGWLAEDDPTLEPYREALANWIRAATVSLDDARKLAVTRAETMIRREHLAEDLSRERFALHSALALYAGEQHLPDTWPRAFFRQSTHAWV